MTTSLVASNRTPKGGDSLLSVYCQLMARLSEYKQIAPFSAEELLDSASALLRDKPGHEVSLRLLRYYTSEGLVPKAIGSSKFARYGYEHLVGLLAIRALLDQGKKLEDAKEELSGIHEGEVAVAEQVATEWLEAFSSQPQNMAYAMRPPAGIPPQRFALESRWSNSTQNVLRISLSKHTTLEISADADVDRELSESIEKISKILSKKKRSSY